jgi:hypothetical protein
MRKIGTKAGAWSAKATKYLSEFGETSENGNQEEVEKYLVKVWKPSSKCDTFDSLRLFENKRYVRISELLPTFHSIKGHILRALYRIRRSVCLLDTVNPIMNPCDFGWEIISDVLRPKKFLNFLPSELFCMCTCKVHTDVIVQIQLLSALRFENAPDCKYAKTFEFFYMS